MPLILEPELPAADLVGRLEQLRRKLCWDIVVSGIARLLAALLAVAILVMASDFVVHWPAPVRAGFLLSGIVGIALLCQRWIRGPLQTANDPLQRARQVEAQTPGLHESLSTVVEFGRRPDDARTVSPQLLHATRTFAVQHSWFVDFTQAVPNKSGVAMASLFGALVLAGAWYFFLPVPQVAVARLLDPYGGHTWPTATMIEVAAPSVIARGDPFRMTAKLTGVIPDRLRLIVVPADATSWEQSYNLSPIDSGTETVAIQLDPVRVPRSFRYQLSANDAATNWSTVTVQVPPRLTALNGRPSPQLRLDYPRYSDLPALKLPDGAGTLEAVFGTHVNVAAAFDRVIRSAWIQWEPNDLRLATATACLPLADLGLNPTIGAITSAALVLQPTKLTFGRTHAECQGMFLPIMNGIHELVFHDADGLKGHWPIDIRLTPDPAPTIEVEEPSSAGNALELTVNSQLRVRATVHDATFAIGRVFLEYRTGPFEPVRTTDVYHGDTLGKALPKLLPWPLEAPSRLRPKRLIIEDRFPVALFHRQDGSPVQAGDVVALTIVATDFDDVTPTKSPGRSTELEIRIVAPDRLAASQRQARQSFVAAIQELHKWQKEALQLAQEAETQRRSTGELRPEDRDALARSAAIQQRIRDRLGDQRDGLRATVERWRQQLEENPIATASDESQANRLANELGRLANEVLPEIGPLLSAARQETEPVPPPARDRGPLPDAVGRQVSAERSLRNLFEQAGAGREMAALATEADAIAAEQEKINRQRDDLKKAIPQGVAPALLDDEQKQQLHQAKETQLQLGQRTDTFARQLEQRAQGLRAEAALETTRADGLDAQNQNLVPTIANDLARQAAQARQRAEQLKAEATAIEAAKKALLGQTGNGDTSLADKMTAAADNIARNQMGSAEEQQQAIAKQIDQVRDALREPTEPEGDRLTKDRRDTEKQLDELIRTQEMLQDRTLATEQQADALERRKLLDELAREQRQLADRARELAEDRRREGQSTLSRELEQAAKSMDQAREKMQQGETGSGEQDHALDRLDDAASQAKRDRIDTEEQLLREKLIKLHERFKGFVDRQTALKAETERLFQVARQSQSWSRSLQSSLFAMARAEHDLAQDINLAAEQNLVNYRVLHRLAKQSAQPLLHVLDAIEKLRDAGLDIKPIDADRATIDQLQSRADQRLRQLLEVLQPPKVGESLSAPNPEGGQKSNQPGGDRLAPENDLIPPDAQVKILRLMQADLRERVETFRKAHPDPLKWTEADRHLLESMRQEQAELIQLFTELAPDNQLQPRDKK